MFIEEGGAQERGCVRGYARQRDFRAAFAADLQHIKEMFPKLPVTTSDHGITLQPADPDVLALPEKKTAYSKGRSLKSR